MLASTVQFSTHDQANPRQTLPPHTPPSNSWTTRVRTAPRAPALQKARTTHPHAHDGTQGQGGPDPSGPNNVSAPPPTPPRRTLPHPPPHQEAGRTRPPGQDTGNGDGILMFHPSTRRGTNAHATGTRHRPPTPNRDGHQVPRCSLERR